MLIKKLTTKILIIIALFFSFNTLPMENRENNRIYRTWTRRLGILYHSAKSLFFEPTNEKFAQERLKQKPYDNAIERLREAVDNEYKIDPCDLILVNEWPKIDEIDILYVEKAEKLLKEQSKNKIEEVLKKSPQCLSCGKKECKICCEKCLTPFCNQECLKTLRPYHYNNCIDQKNFSCRCLLSKRSLLLIAQKNEKNEMPDPEDLYLATHCTEEDNKEGLKIIKESEKIIESNIKETNSSDQKCNFCETRICKNCNKPHSETKKCSESKNKSAIKCKLCLLANFCDEICLKDNLLDHRAKCFKRICELKKIKNSAEEKIQKSLTDTRCQEESLRPEILANEENISDNKSNMYQETYYNLKSFLISKDYSFSNESTKDKRIDCIWLKTVNHYAPEITSCVYMEAIKKNPHAKLNDPRNTNEFVENFDPNCTSGSQALRNALIISDFLNSLKNNEGLDRKKLSLLSNPNDAQIFLEDLMLTHHPSNLDYKEITFLLGNKKKLGDISVLDSIFELENIERESEQLPENKIDQEKNNSIFSNFISGFNNCVNGVKNLFSKPEPEKEIIHKNLNEIIKAFKSKDIFHHTFIVNTANILNYNIENKDGQTSNILDIVSEELYEDTRFKPTSESLTELKNKIAKQKNASDWYVISLIKIGNKIITLIIDTDIKHMAKTSTTSIFLPEYILDSKNNPLEIVRSKTKHEAKIIIELSIKSKILIRFHESKPLMVNEKNKMPQEKMKNILRFAPKQIKNFIDLESIKKDLEENKGNKVSLNKSKAILLYGPCGTGKSELSKAIAQKTGRRCCFIRCAVTGTELQHSESQNLQKEILPIIEDYKKNGKPYLIVFDEIDSIGNENNSKLNHQDTGAAISSIMDDCEPYDIMLIFTTNGKKQLDKKLKDRLTEIDFELPSKTERKEFLIYFLKERKKIAKKEIYINLNYDNVNIDWIASETNGFSIRAIKALVEYACNNAHLEIFKKTPKADQDKIKEILLNNEDFEDQLSSTQKAIAESKELEETPLEIIVDHILYPIGKYAFNLGLGSINDLSRAYFSSIGSHFATKCMATYNFDKTRTMLEKEIVLSQNDKAKNDRLKKQLQKLENKYVSIISGTDLDLPDHQEIAGNAAVAAAASTEATDKKTREIAHSNCLKEKAQLEKQLAKANTNEERDVINKKIKKVSELDHQAISGVPDLGVKTLSEELWDGFEESAKSISASAGIDNKDGAAPKAGVFVSVNGGIVTGPLKMAKPGFLLLKDKASAGLVYTKEKSYALWLGSKNLSKKCFSFFSRTKSNQGK